jgi:hypothetical protein
LIELLVRTEAGSLRDVEELEALELFTAAAIVAEFAASVPPEECPFAENTPDWRTWWRRRGRSWDELGYYFTDQDRADRLRQLKT